MRDAEAVMLYHQAMSVTPNQPTEFGADMWCEVLRDLRYADARESLITLVKRSTFASPAEIRAEVHKVRAARCARHGEPIPPSDLTPLATIEWLRDAYRRIGDGEHLPATRGELRQRPPIPLLGRRMDEADPAMANA